MENNKETIKQEEVTEEVEMITPKSWGEFYNTGLLWWVNSMLHLFGWAIVVEQKDDTTMLVYPARCRFRGFDSEASHAHS